MDEIQRAKEIIQGYKGRPLRIMEVCGTHTHEIFKLGIRNILPENIRLISGPGCPVCVTPVSYIDEAVYLADKIVLLDKNPGKIAEVIEVDLERPRKRDSQEFLDIQESIVGKLDMEE